MKQVLRILMTLFVVAATQGTFGQQPSANFNRDIRPTLSGHSAASDRYRSSAPYVSRSGPRLSSVWWKLVRS
ncbi:MAG: hypothetical protein GY903_20155 [Fuerstiella sp.]|nr:hypothetical protein [Fuerstiella sp.]MCP4856803.1 hypothetical protein [Fuerstiella sp.]